MIDVSDLFNNPCDSDVHIVLSDKRIFYAHRLVLRRKSSVLSKLLDLTPNTLSFEGVSDTVVQHALMYIYGATDTLSNRLGAKDGDAMWTALVRFCARHEIDLERLMSHLPDSVSISQLVAVGNQIASPQLILEAVRRLDGASLAGQQVDEVLHLRPHLYTLLRSEWLRSSHSKFNLLRLDCHYCSTFDKVCQIGELGRLMVDIPMATFTRSELMSISTTFPIFSTVPLLRTLVCQIGPMYAAQ